MNKDVGTLAQQIFVPTPPVQRITTRQTLGKIQVAPLKHPESICGVARRTGYTGKGNEDLATYRLKIKVEGSKTFMTLPSIFVVEDGVFLDYEAWHSQQGSKQVKYT
ncbi:MAG: hypothetical protein JO031_05675 [Ktedonobacteraceae bacterium]|nr:hypothetical protein [Ktedonobacteraceae bacterium]